MSDVSPWSGGCHCGAVRYRSAAEPVASGNCHCTDCARLSGAVSHSVFLVPRGAVTITGEVTWYESAGDSGGKVQRGFCPRCGTRLFATADKMPELMTISALSLDDTSVYRPQVNIFTRSAVAWAVLDEALPAFETMPPAAPG